MVLVVASLLLAVIPVASARAETSTATTDAPTQAPPLQIETSNPPSRPSSRAWDPDSDDVPGITLDRAPEPAPEPETAPPRLYLVPRFGTMSVRGSSAATHLVPSVGLGLEWHLRPWLGISARYDASYSNRGTSEVTLRRIGQSLVATADGRVRLGRAASLRAGVGAGAAFVIATSVFPSDTKTATALEPGLAWLGSFDVMLPGRRVGFSFGASGLLHAMSHDVLYFAGISFALDRPSDAGAPRP